MGMKQVAPSALRGGDPPMFEADEVPFYLMYRLLASDEALVLTDEASALLIQTAPDRPAWVWTAQDITLDAVHALAGACRKHGIREAVAKPSVAMHLFDHPKVNERLLANVCTGLRPPVGIAGHADGFSQEEERKVAGLFALFDQDAHGRESGREAFLEHAAQMRGDEGFRVWRDGRGEIVSMARIAQDGPRYARISFVCTDTASRGKGYAGAAVAALCEKAMAAGLTPMLYTDAGCHASNRAYQKIGFVPAGELWRAQEG